MEVDDSLFEVRDKSSSGHCSFLRIIVDNSGWVIVGLQKMVLGDRGFLYRTG